MCQLINADVECKCRSPILPRTLLLVILFCNGSLLPPPHEKMCIITLKITDQS